MAEEINYEKEISEISYFTDTHARGRLGRWLTGKEMIDVWAQVSFDYSRALDAIDKLKRAQQRSHLTAFGVSALALIVGVVAGYIVALSQFGGR